MRCIRSLLLCALVVACVPAVGFAQGGYFSRGYSSYYFPRPYNNTYHGYWRDLGYGFSPQPYYGVHRYSERWVSPYYYGPGYGSSYHYGGHYGPGPQINYYGW
jgi:hypothetical protein